MAYTTFYAGYVYSLTVYYVYVEFSTLFLQICVERFFDYEFISCSHIELSNIWVK